MTDQPKKSKSYTTDDTGGILVTDKRQLTHGTIVPNYVVDLYLPIIGYDGLGILTALYRLVNHADPDNPVRVNVRAFARAGRVGSDSYSDSLELMAECGLIALLKPEGKRRGMHLRTEIFLVDPPTRVPERYAAQVLDRCLTPWLIQNYATTTESLAKDSPVLIQGFANPYPGTPCNVPTGDVPTGDVKNPKLPAGPALENLSKQAPEATGHAPGETRDMFAQVLPAPDITPAPAEPIETPARPREPGPGAGPGAPTHQDFVAAYMALLPYKLSKVQAARMGKGAKRACELGLSVQDVQDCYAFMKAKSKFYATEHLSLELVVDQVGAWIAAGRPGKKPSDTPARAATPGRRGDMMLERIKTRELPPDFPGHWYAETLAAQAAQTKPVEPSYQPDYPAHARKQTLEERAAWFHRVPPEERLDEVETFLPPDKRHLATDRPDDDEPPF